MVCVCGLCDRTERREERKMQGRVVAQLLDMDGRAQLGLAQDWSCSVAFAGGLLEDCPVVGKRFGNWKTFDFQPLDNAHVIQRTVFASH